MSWNYLTFDIEDNFEFGELTDPGDWVQYEPQVVENTKKILNLLDEHHVKATFFILGKVAERRPEIVPLIVERGHRIASHGYSHKPVKDLGLDGFDEDLRKSKEILEAQSKADVKGFRAMGFSIRASEAWALEVISRVGHGFDSSLLSSRLKLSKEEFSKKPKILNEIPVNSFCWGGRHVPLGGGIFFRLVPASILGWIVRQINNRGEKFVIYLHAWEFNQDQPRRRVGFFQNLAQAPITFTTEKKLRKLLKEFKFGPI